MWIVKPATNGIMTRGNETSLSLPKEEMTQFGELGIKQTILDALVEQGFKEAFPIQEAAIPVLLSGRDVIGQAHTGTGKTAAYAISMLQTIEPGKGVQGLVIAPTRELALQITMEIKKFGSKTGIRAIAIYGGAGMGPQLGALERGVDIVVATPGRLIDHINRRTVNLDKIAHVVLDEADTMLDMGFVDDIKKILSRTPKDKVMSMFSATMPVPILRLSEQYLRNPKQFLLDADDLSGEGIDQSFLVLRDREKIKYLIQFIRENEEGQSIVFCSTKWRTRDVSKLLRDDNFNTVTIEGDMSQNKREHSMSKFRQGKADILVATDVAARGIDVPEVALVVNYDVPNQEMVYFHRIGRTARAGNKGRAITLVSYSSLGDFNIIKKQIKSNMTDLNLKMGIEVNIPDKLKREVTRAGHGFGRRPGGGSGGFSRRPRSNYDGPRGRDRGGGSKSSRGSRFSGRSSGSRFGGSSSNRSGGYSGSRFGGSSSNRSGGYSGSRDGNRSGGYSGSRDGNRSGGYSGSRDGNRSGGYSGSRDGNRSGGYSGSRDGNRSGGYSGSRDGNRSGGYSGSRDGNRSGGYSGSRDGNRSGGYSGSRDGNRSGGYSGSRDGNRSGGYSGSRDGNRSGGYSGSRDGNRSGGYSGSRDGNRSGGYSGSRDGNRSGGYSGSRDGERGGRDGDSKPSSYRQHKNAGSKRQYNGLRSRW